MGEVWPRERIRALREMVEANGLTLKVIESVNVSDDIKIGTDKRDAHIEAYKETIKNLGQEGVKVICYNFMPVFDWVKSDLDYKLPDGSSTLAFVKANIPDDPQEIIDTVAEGSGGFTLPGWEPERLAQVKSLFEAYKDVDEEKLRENLVYFLEAIMPVCEEYDVKMAIHPDDPPYSMWGLPRIIKNREGHSTGSAVPSTRLTTASRSVAVRSPRSRVTTSMTSSPSSRAAAASTSCICATSSTFHPRSRATRTSTRLRIPAPAVRSICIR